MVESQRRENVRPGDHLEPEIKVSETLPTALPDQSVATAPAIPAGTDQPVPSPVPTGITTLHTEPEPTMTGDGDHPPQPEVFMSTLNEGFDPPRRTELPPALIKADRAVITFTADKSVGKIRVQANQFDDTRVIEPGRQFVIRYIEGQVRVFDVAIE